jgi:hypothetical protein
LVVDSIGVPVHCVGALPVARAAFLSKRIALPDVLVKRRASSVATVSHWTTSTAKSSTMARWVSLEARPYKSHVGVSKTTAAKMPSIMKATRERNAVQLRAERHFVVEAGRGCKQRAKLLTFQRDALPTVPI